MTSYDEVDRVTISEYGLMVDVLKQRQEEKDYWVHKQAWLSAIVKNTKSNGKPQFRHFDDFYKLPKKEPDKRVERYAEYLKKNEREKNEY